MKALSSGRRNRFIVDKHYQWRTTLIGVLYILAVGFFVAFPFAYLMRATNGLLAGYHVDLTNSFNNLQRLTLISGLFFLLSIVAAWTYFSLRRSHRVAGPVVNIARMVDEFAKGNYSARVKLREHDEL